MFQKNKIALAVARGASQIVPAVGEVHPVRLTMFTSQHIPDTQVNRFSTLPMLRTPEMYTLGDAIGSDYHINVVKRVLEVIPVRKKTPQGVSIILHTIVYMAPDGKVGVFEYKDRFLTKDGQEPLNMIDPYQLRAGDEIPAGIPWQIAPRKDPEVLGLGTSPLCILTGSHTVEDGLAVTPDMLEDPAFTYTINNSVTIIVPPNMTLRSLAGRGEPYHPIPITGEAIPPCGTIARLYPVESGINPHGTDCSDEIISTNIPGSVVTSIEVIMDAQTKRKKDESGLIDFLQEHVLLDDSYKERLCSILEKYRGSLHDSAIVEYYKIKPVVAQSALEYKKKRVRLMLKINFQRVHHMQPGSKLTGMYGDKGTVTHVIPEKDILYDELGRKIRFYHSANSTIGRVNPARTHVHAISGGMLTLSHRLKNMVGLHPVQGAGDVINSLNIVNSLDPAVKQDMINMVLEFYKVVLPSNYKILTEGGLIEEELNELLVAYLADEELQVGGLLWALYDNTECRDEDLINRWLNDEFKVERHILHTADGRETSQRFMVAPYFIMMLDKPPFKSKAISIVHHNPLGVPGEDPTVPYPTIAVRMGELEIPMLGFNCPDGFVEQLMRSTSAEGASKLARSILKDGSGMSDLEEVDFSDCPMALDSFISNHLEMQGLAITKGDVNGHIPDTEMMEWIINNPNY